MARPLIFNFSLTGVIVSFPLDAEIDILRSVHSLTPGTDFLRTSSSGGGGGGGGAVTPTGFSTILNQGQISVGPTSGLLLDANTLRAYAHLFNNSQDTAYIQYGAPAVVGQGIPIKPGSFYTIKGYELWLGAVNAISAGTPLIDIFEAGY